MWRSAVRLVPAARFARPVARCTIRLLSTPAELRARALAIIEREFAGPQETAEAVKMFASAAERGDAEADFYLGLAYHGLLEGDPVELDAERATRCYRRAAEGGYAPAMFNLALACKKGDGLPDGPDPAEATRWYVRAAEAGDARGMFSLGLARDPLHRDVQWPEIDKDANAAAGWYAKAREAGHVKASTNLGILYWEGLSDGAAGMYEEARRRFARELWEEAAEAGVPEARRCLAQAEDVWRDDPGP